jgi:hypothetical protein
LKSGCHHWMPVWAEVQAGPRTRKFRVFHRQLVFPQYERLITFALLGGEA